MYKNDDSIVMGLDEDFEYHTKPNILCRFLDRVEKWLPIVCYLR